MASKWMVLYNVVCILMTVASSQSPSCNKPTDIVFLLDGSDSISAQNWKRQLNFLEKIVDNFNINPEGTRVGVVVFSSFIGDVIELKATRSKEFLKETIRNLQHPQFGTNTAEGIERVREMFKSSGRKNTPWISILVTDGRSINPFETIKEGKAAQKDGISMIAVGVGNNIYRDELKKVASTEKDMFTVTNYTALPGIVVRIRDRIRNRMCSVPSCFKPTDIVFLLDGSDSISPQNWKRQLNFLENIVDNFDINPEGTRVGVVVFSAFIGDVITLQAYRSKEMIQARIRGLQHPQFGTNTAEGIERVREMFKSSGRRNTPWISVLVTDGRSINPSETIKEGKAAQKDGITTIAVGVGDDVFLDELKEFTSTKEHLFTVTDFTALLGLRGRISERICSDS